MHVCVSRCKIRDESTRVMCMCCHWDESSMVCGMNGLFEQGQAF